MFIKMAINSLILISLVMCHCAHFSLIVMVITITITKISAQATLRMCNVANTNHRQLKDTNKTSRHLVCFLWGRDNKTAKSGTTSLI